MKNHSNGAIHRTFLSSIFFSLIASPIPKIGILKRTHIAKKGKHIAIIEPIISPTPDTISDSPKRTSRIPDRNKTTESKSNLNECRNASQMFFIYSI